MQLRRSSTSPSSSKARAIILARVPIAALALVIAPWLVSCDTAPKYPESWSAPAPVQGGGASAASISVDGIYSADGRFVAARLHDDDYQGRSFLPELLYLQEAAQKNEVRGPKGEAGGGMVGVSVVGTRTQWVDGNIAGPVIALEFQTIDGNRIHITAYRAFGLPTQATDFAFEMRDGWMVLRRLRSSGFTVGLAGGGSGVAPVAIYEELADVLLARKAVDGSLVLRKQEVTSGAFIVIPFKESESEWHQFAPAKRPDHDPRTIAIGVHADIPLPLTRTGAHPSTPLPATWTGVSLAPSLDPLRYLAWTYYSGGESTNVLGEWRRESRVWQARASLCEMFLESAAYELHLYSGQIPDPHCGSAMRLRLDAGRLCITAVDSTGPVTTPHCFQPTVQTDGWVRLRYAGPDPLPQEKSKRFDRRGGSLWLRRLDNGVLLAYVEQHRVFREPTSRFRSREVMKVADGWARFEAVPSSSSSPATAAH